MSKIKIQGDGGGTGTFTIISPNTDSSNTITLPDTTGTLVTSSQSIVPSQDNTFDLGSSTHKWKDIWVSGSTINLGNQTIKASETGIVLPELTIGTGTNTVKLAASPSGKLEQTGTNSSGVVAPVVNIPTVLTDLTDVDLTVAATDTQVLRITQTGSGALETFDIPQNQYGIVTPPTFGKVLTVNIDNRLGNASTDAARTAGTYTGVTGTSGRTALGFAGGPCTVGTFDIIVDSNGTVTDVTVVTSGIGHIAGDVITIADADLGGGGAEQFSVVVATTDIRTGGTYTSVTGTSSGTGTVGTFNIIVDSSVLHTPNLINPFPDFNQLTTTVHPITKGNGHSIGDIITISDADLGGGGAPDYKITVSTTGIIGSWQSKDSILNFSDFTDVDTVTTTPTDRQVLSWNNTNSTWSPSPNGAPFIVATTTELVALTGMTAGVRALVTELNRLYVYTGAPAGTNWRHAVSGWYAIADITTTNGKPPAVTGVSPTYVLDDLGESIVVTTAAVDPEQMPLTWSWAITTGSKTDNTTVVQRDITTPTDTSNEFTITPGIYPWDTSSFSITFSVADDSIDTTDAIGAFTLTILLPNWGTNSNWHSEISNLDFNAADSASMNGSKALFYGQSIDMDDRGDVIIVSDPYYAIPKSGTTGVNEVGAIHIYNKTTTSGISTWSKNNQILVDPIDAAAGTGGDGNPVSVTNIGGFAGNRGTVDDMSTGDQIALSSDGKNIVSMYGNGANTRAPTFNFDSATSTYLAGDSLYLTDVLDRSGNQDGIYLGPNNTLGQTVLGTQPKLAVSKDGNTCILGYGMEGPKGMKFTYVDPRTDHPLISPHGSLDFPEFGHDRHVVMNNLVDAASTGRIKSLLHHAGVWLDVLRTAGTYAAVTGTSSGTGTVGTFDIVVDANGQVTSVTLVDRGSGHVVGDIITIADANLGAGGAADVTLTVLTIDQTSNRVAGTYTGVTGTSSGTGTVGKFNVTVDTGGLATPTITNTGYGHAVGDVITIADADLGGGIAPDVTLTVATIESTDIVSSGGTVNDFIDTDVIIDTNGARASLDVGQVNYGAAYIFEKTGTGTNTGTPLWNSTNSEWGLTKKISGVNIVDTLGASVDLAADGTVAIVSAPRGTTDINSLTTPANGGYVTVFDSTTTNGSWTQVATLRPPTNIIDNSGTFFGQHKYVDTFGAPDALRTVGTYTNVTGTSSNGSGTVGFFNIIVSSGGNVTSVIPITLGTGNVLGDTITISDANLGAGGAADFTFNVTKDSGINARHNRGHFGDNSISISGDGKTIAVGDSGSALENPLATTAKLSSHPFSSGVVHMYKNVSGTWTYTETLFSLAGSSQDGFGNSVDLNLNGQILTVGAIKENGNKFTLDNTTSSSVTTSGAVYMFELNGADGTVDGTWKQVKRETILPYEQSNNGSLMGRPKVSADGKTIITGRKSLQTDNNSGRVEIWKENEVNNMGDITGLDVTYDFGFEGLIMGNFSTSGLIGDVYDIGVTSSSTGHASRTPGTYTNVPTTNYINSSGVTGTGIGLIIPTVVIHAASGVYANPPVGTTGMQAGSATFYMGTPGDTSGNPARIVPVGFRGTGYNGGDAWIILDADLGGGGAPPVGRMGDGIGANVFLSFLTISQVSTRPSGTYTDVTGTTSGSGTVGTFDIVVNSSGVVTSATTKTVGTSPTQGDTITISDSSLGNGGIPDLTMDIITVGISDRNSKEITVSVDDPTNNEIWWSFATSNNTSGGVVTEKRHATPFDISKSQTDEVSEFSSGNWTPIDNSTMNNFYQGPISALGVMVNSTSGPGPHASNVRVVGTYTGVVGTSSGTGTVLPIDIIVQTSAETPFVQGFVQLPIDAQATVLQPQHSYGHGHSVGDVITWSDADLGGGGAPDHSITILSISNGDRTTGSYTGVTGTSSGTGTAGTFDIVVDSTGLVTDATVVTLGTGHTVGDTITISDANLGNGGASDFTMDIATISDIAAVIRRLYGNTNRPRSFKMESLDNVGTATPITTDFDYVALNTVHPFTNPTGTGPENTFVITPNADTSVSGGSFDLTITATDGVNTKTATTTISLPIN